MSFELSDLDDFLVEIADGTEAVTVTLVRVAGNTSVSIGNALRQPVSRKFSGMLNIETAECVFNIANIQLNPNGNEGRVIQPRDLITDASNVVFIVVAVFQATLRSRWEVICNRKN